MGLFQGPKDSSLIASVVRRGCQREIGFNKSVLMQLAAEDSDSVHAELHAAFENQRAAI